MIPSLSDNMLLAGLLLNVSAVIFAMWVGKRSADSAARLLVSTNQQVGDRVAETARLLAIKQDQTSAAVNETAARLSIKQDQTVEALVATARNLQENTSITNEKLDVIHTLVNSSLTAALKDQLTAMGAQLFLLQQVTDLHAAGGRGPTQGALDAIITLDERVKELTNIIALREKQQVTLDNLTATTVTGVLRSK